MSEKSKKVAEFPYKPMADKIIVTIEELSNRRGSLYIPTTVNRSCELYQGEVIATGPGRVNDKGVKIPMTLKVGDRIMYGGNFTGTDLEVEGTKYKLMKEVDALCIVEEGVSTENDGWR
jgi:chaperonin GroES